MQDILLPFPLAKVDLIMSKANNNGFMLLEMIICLSVISMMVVISLPIINQLNLERKIIEDRIDIHHSLYNEIQIVEIKDLPLVKTERKNNLIVELSIIIDDDLIIGQGVWTNERNQVETANAYFKIQD